MEGHVRVELIIHRDMNTGDCAVDLEIGGCEDIPDNLIMPTAHEGLRRALEHMSDMVLISEVAEVIHEVLHEMHSEKERKHDGSADAGESEAGV